ncbi:flagellar basal body rod protein FlgC [Antarcticirhabdus aurantiaca]|uniref:Flagellar basal body rod protein FlgC n=1 Tax=Antarcticirhabdus aurantiaca TaxID=2606717 RepID=A0ACD4NXF2_9HYPH|nr:flagellar basal body rod protein FlgC [Antarcticirhabdus aurantiaca]WAJ31404.1 flagellar basal body rod protein FlgC [Jeongeuplla avenae]
MKVAASGLQAQSTRLRIVSENIANARSTGETAGADPYRRKTVTFENVLDSVADLSMVRVNDINTDQSAFKIEHDPGNPAADANGNVKMPNVEMLVEMADMREANRSYDANLQVVKQARQMINMTIDLLRS